MNQQQPINSNNKNGACTLKKFDSMKSNESECDFNALWLDPFSSPTESHKKALEDASIKLLSVVTLDDLKKVLEKTNLVVIRIKDNTNLYDEVFSLTKSVKEHLPIVCRIDRNEFELGIESMRKGAFQVFPSDCTNSDEWKKLVELIKKHTYKKKNSYVFVDQESKKLLKLTEKVAQADVTTLITGPTGSGKEVLSRILHDASKRFAAPFVSINCGAIPENLMEDLLFGHEKGAFTGAIKDHRGVFEQANKGTLFLDEIGELPPHLQTKLLRVLQERVVTRLGSTSPIEVNFRLVAATNKDLKEAIRNREFREDLYFRISTFRLKISPLYKRKEDILPLAAQIITNHSTDEITISSEAQDKLLNYQWPGNVRELDNVIQRALVLCSGNEIMLDDLIFDEITNFENFGSEKDENLLEKKVNKQDKYEDQKKLIEIPEIKKLEESSCTDVTGDNLNLDEAVRLSEFKTIVTAIRSTNSRNDAAKKLGISPRTLRYKIAQLKSLETPEFSFE